MELAWRGNGIRGNRHEVPVCVIAAGADALFTPDEVEATAHRLETTAIVLDGLPHMLMLERGWEDLALTLDAWISGLKK
jgi:pimeloyl-ACP methyl ester carboxylesterase